MKYYLMMLCVLLGTLGCDDDFGAGLDDAGSSIQKLTSECKIYVDPSATEEGSGTSWDDAITSLDGALDAAEAKLETVEGCDIVTHGDIDDMSGYEQRLAKFNGRIEIKSEAETVETGNVQTSASTLSSKSAVVDSSSTRTFDRSNVDDRNVLADALESVLESKGLDQSDENDIDYMPLAACSCDSFSGRVEFPASPDANGAANSGVIEIGNALRLDSNEIITNTNGTLFLQHDNNGDLRVDNSTLMVDASANRVGIGTTAPSATLDVEGDISMEAAFFDGWSSNYASGLNIETYVLAVKSRTFSLRDQNGDTYAYFSSDDDSLTVKGTIEAKELVLDADLADYVFQDGYDLKSLEEVESFIKDNNHLPDMPSETDVDAHGLSVADFNNLLLQKIEELTLHMIDQNNTVKSQQKKIDRLEKALASMK